MLIRLFVKVVGEIVFALCNMPCVKQVAGLDKLPYSVRCIALNRNKETKTQFGRGNYEKAIAGLVREDSKPLKYDESPYREKNWQIRRMLLDQDMYLPGDILCKADRASMKYSLEARCTILDHRVIEYSYQIPQKYKFYKRDKKHILKEIAYDYIPRELLDRPKVGFALLLDDWFRKGKLREQV